MNWISCDFPGSLQFDLYLNGQSVGKSALLGHSGTGNFAGVVSDVPFNEAFVIGLSGTVFIDDMHFGGVTADFDDDGVIGPFDLATILGNWGDCPKEGVFCPNDLNLDGAVGPADLAILLGNWGFIE